ncbi:HAD family phosphatase [Tardiphaga alba]|uniref:HAD family phosphatase n=1 Tax=Tardiphaga alba TaxID=340268 RepID=A0ABX8AAP8_9BRAD|nr:HAD family hydrolase [Tardiphaga alba]QUS38870.1 HAD family phosphatase [Tardiphaga alba]
MTKIALVVSDVDGTLVTHDKRLTDKAKAAVKKLEDNGIAFTVTSSRPPVGMRFLIDPLGITLPIGPFNGSSIVDGNLKPITQHLIGEAAAAKSIAVLDKYDVDVWIFTNDEWVIKRDDGKYVPHERDTIQHAPLMVDDFTPYLAKACKIVGASPDFPLLERCEAEMQQVLGDSAVAVRSQHYYLDVTPPAQSKGTFVKAMAERLGISLDAIATVGDMQNDLPMFAVSGMSIAMGNATDAVKSKATDVTTSNEDEGFAGAVELVLKRNAGQ